MVKMIHGGLTILAAGLAVVVLGGCKWAACGAGDCRSSLPEPTAKGATTFRGALNRLLSYLKHNFPRQQIVLCTAIHRGFAQFGSKNIQPEESFPNLLGLYIDDYNDDIRQAGRIWSVPVLDLYERSGLLPTDDAYVHYFHDGNTDRLHPSSDGHERISRTMMRWMMTIPSDFK